MKIAIGIDLGISIREVSIGNGLKPEVLYDKEGPGWWVERHHGFGMGVRNALRMGGLQWRSDVLDDAWSILFEEATKKYVEVNLLKGKVKSDNSISVGSTS